jgi:hypothetical protein
MKLTRGHFQVIADAIATFETAYDTNTELAEHFADQLSRTNPNFDRERFLTACGVVV